jgi:hypothetical protein
MSKARKPSTRQLFNQFLRKEKARRKLADETSRLDALSTQIGPIEQVVEHEDTLYKMRTHQASLYGGGRFELHVECLGDATDFRQALELKQ